MPKPKRSRSQKLLARVLIALAVLLGLEVVFRGILLVEPSLSERIDRHRERAAPELDAGVTLEPHPYWAYNQSTLLPSVNDFGFSGEDLPFQKAPDTFRVVCLGASTTAGEDNWPSFLTQVLADRGVKAEVVNLATQGWTSAENLVAFALLGQDYQPDAVVLHMGHNDLAPLMGVDFRPDYAHYRRPLAVTRNEMGVLEVKQDITWAVDWTLVRWSSIYVYLRLWVVGDQPTVYSLDNLAVQDGYRGEDPTAHVATFERNLRTIGVIAKSLDAQVVAATQPYVDLGAPGWAAKLDNQNRVVAELARKEGWALAPLHEQEWDPAWFVDDLHLNAEGNRVKAERIADALLAP